jgi:hypothetical protein
LRYALTAGHVEIPEREAYGRSIASPIDGQRDRDVRGSACAFDLRTRRAFECSADAGPNRREQNLQNVPMTIPVLTRETLANLNATTFDDFVKYLPLSPRMEWVPVRHIPSLPPISLHLTCRATVSRPRTFGLRFSYKFSAR